jgi:hypothetical protein
MGDDERGIAESGSVGTEAPAGVWDGVSAQRAGAGWVVRDASRGRYAEFTDYFG